MPRSPNYAQHDFLQRVVTAIARPAIQHFSEDHAANTLELSRQSSGASACDRCETPAPPGLPGRESCRASRSHTACPATRTAATGNRRTACLLRCPEQASALRRAPNSRRYASPDVIAASPRLLVHAVGPHVDIEHRPVKCHHARSIAQVRQQSGHVAACRRKSWDSPEPIRGRCLGSR